MFYIPNVDLAYLSVDYIMRDVYSGWSLDFYILMEHLCFL